jgi:hypothetical protein
MTYHSSLYSLNDYSLVNAISSALVEVLWTRRLLTNRRQPSVACANSIDASVQPLSCCLSLVHIRQHIEFSVIMHHI